MAERGNRDIKSRSIWRWISRLGALFRRSWRQNVRDVNLNVFRLLANIGNAMLLAGIFPTVQGPVPTTSSIADRVALLSFGAVNLCMLAYMKTIHLFSQERPVIEREQIRDQYSAAEYLLAKMLAEIPLDAGFSAVFTTVLKKCTGLQISWKSLTSIFALLTTAGASLGFLIGSLVPSEQYATTAGIPILVVLLIVGVINPSGVDPTKPKPFLVRLVKKFSPFAYAIEALCVEEYPGVHFQFPKRRLWERLRAVPRMGGLALVTVIEALGLSDVSYAGAMKHLAILAAGYTVASWFGLIMQQQHRRRVKASIKKPSAGRDKSNGRNLAKVPTRFRL